ncbi:MAG: hypothetical protein R3D62_11680 [Xanthobacteraceae bacterium]
MQVTKLVSLVAGSLVASKLGAASGPPVRAEEFLAFRSEPPVSSAFAGGRTLHVNDARAAGEYTYLAPPGAGPDAFPRPQRPVAPVVSPNRASEEERDANDEAGQLARLMGFKPGMTIADIGRQRLSIRSGSRLLGHSGLAVIAQDARPQ